MKEFPLVSVVTPSYNHAKYIQATVESVVHQTYKNIEYFVIDDGSTDESDQILHTLCKVYGFYFESQPNKGLIPTMNKLISLCKGKYIAIIESDDVWTLDKIEKQVAFMENHPEIGACGGNVLNINEKNEILPYYFQRFKRFKIFDFIDILSFSYYLPSITVMVRTEALVKVGLFDEKIKIVDLFIWLKITHHNYSIALLPDLFGFYRIHEANTSKNNRLMFRNKLYIVRQYKGEKGYVKGLVKIYLHYYLHNLLKIVPTELFPFKRS